jgi:hypothetical protein
LEQVGTERSHEGNDAEEEVGMTPTLTPHDITAPSAGERCDRCSAEAKVRAVLPGGGDLVFCQHHANRYRAQLEKVEASFATDSQ